MASLKEIEARLTALEREVELIKEQLRVRDEPWWQEWYGAFKDDPVYEEAMKLGREWRDSQKPKPRKKSKSKAKSKKA